MTAVVSLQALRKEFGSGVAVRDLSLDIAEGEFFSLIGPSGCGKTTTLRMVAGLERPTAGRVLVGGLDVTEQPAHKRPVNTVFQSYALFPHLTVFENVAFGLRERREPRDRIAAVVAEMLELVELTGRDGARPRELSGGQQQRVALARALVMEPRVLLLDEPLGALDLRLRKQMQILLKRVQRHVGTTFVYVTHDQEEAFAMSDRVGVMRGGVLEQIGSPMDVYRQPVTRGVAEFVGASNRFEGRIVGRVGDSYRVELDDVPGERSVRGVPGLETGSQVAVIVRPESARLVAPGPDAYVRGELTDVQQLGPQTLYLVAIPSGRVATACANGAADDREHVSAGGEVGLRWDDSAAWAVAAPR
jgi:spermidine/putrescine transport system ATP-binding protein